MSNASYTLDALPQVIEYGHPFAKAHAGVVELIDERAPTDDWGKRFIYGSVRLERRSAGYYCAGSMMGLRSACFAVTYTMRDGAMCGRNFGLGCEADARRLFEKMTS